MEGACSETFSRCSTFSNSSSTTTSTSSCFSGSRTLTTGRGGGSSTKYLDDMPSPSTFLEAEEAEYAVHKLGEPGTALFRAVFRRRRDGAVISPWHDIPLYDKECQLHCICTTPAAASLQHCFSAVDAYNPLCCRPEAPEASGQQLPWYAKGVQQRSAAAPAPEAAAVAHYVSACPWNVAVLPQTVHSEDDVFHGCEGLQGSGTPIEIIDISGRRVPLGTVFSVKPVAAFAVQSGPKQFCWKIVGVAGDSPLASLTCRLSDVEEYFPGELQRVQEWLAMCCSYSNSSEAFPSPQGPDEAHVAVAQANATWQLFMEEGVHPAAAEALHGLTNELLLKIWGRQPWVLACHVTDEDPFADVADAELGTPGSARKQQGGGAGGGLQGLGKLLRSSSFRAKPAGNSRLLRKQTSSRPPTAPHPSYGPLTTSASTATSVAAAGPGRGAETRDQGDGDVEVYVLKGGSSKQSHRASASVDLGCRNCHKGATNTHPDHVRCKSDTETESAWGQIMFIDQGNAVSSTSHMNAAQYAMAACSGLISSPGSAGSAGSRSPSGFASPVDCSSPVRKPPNLSPLKVPTGGTRGGSILRNRSYNGNVEYGAAGDCGVEGILGIPRPRSSSMPRSAARAFAIQSHFCATRDAEPLGGLPSAGSRGQSPPHVSDVSASSSPDVGPVTSSGPSSHQQTMVGAAFKFPRSRSATAPRTLEPTPEVRTCPRSNSVGRKVTFSEEVEMVLLGEDDLGEGVPGESSSGQSVSSALHVSMPLAPDGEGPPLGSPRLYSMQQLWSVDCSGP